MVSIGEYGPETHVQNLPLILLKMGVTVLFT